MFLPNWIDSLGYGYAQLKICLAGGGVWTADGAELLLISSVTRAVSYDWELSPFQRGCIVSIVFVGVFSGNLFSGHLGDGLGRRIPILISYFMIVLFSVLSAMTQEFWGLIITRFLVGASFGIGQPPVNSLSAETVPAQYRVLQSVLIGTMFIFGEIYSALLIWFADPDMSAKNFPWRRLIIMGTIPSVILGLYAVFVLVESPFWLLTRKKKEEAEKVLEELRKDNEKSRRIQWLHIHPRIEEIACIQDLIQGQEEIEKQAQENDGNSTKNQQYQQQQAVNLKVKQQQHLQVKDSDAVANDVHARDDNSSAVQSQTEDLISDEDGNQNRLNYATMQQNQITIQFLNNYLTQCKELAYEDLPETNHWKRKIVIDIIEDQDYSDQQQVQDDHDKTDDIRKLKLRPAIPVRGDNPNEGPLEFDFSQVESQTSESSDQAQQQSSEEGPGPGPHQWNLQHNDITNDNLNRTNQSQQSQQSQSVNLQSTMPLTSFGTGLAAIDVSSSLSLASMRQSFIGSLGPLGVGQQSALPINISNFGSRIGSNYGSRIGSRTSTRQNSRVYQGQIIPGFNSTNSTNLNNQQNLNNSLNNTSTSVIKMAVNTNAQSIIQENTNEQHDQQDTAAAAASGTATVTNADQDQVSSLPNVSLSNGHRNLSLTLRRVSDPNISSGLRLGLSPENARNNSTNLNQIQNQNQNTNNYGTMQQANFNNDNSNSGGNSLTNTSTLTHSIGNTNSSQPLTQTNTSVLEAQNNDSHHHHHHHQTALQAYLKCFTPPFLQQTLVICYSTFVINFVYYGGLYAFPNILAAMKKHDYQSSEAKTQQSVVNKSSEVSPAFSLFLGAVAEIPGATIFSLYMGIWFTRKGGILLYLIICSLGTFAFTMGGKQLLPKGVKIDPNQDIDLSQSKVQQNQEGGHGGKKKSNSYNQNQQWQLGNYNVDDDSNSNSYDREMLRHSNHYQQRSHSNHF